MVNRTIIELCFDSTLWFSSKHQAPVSFWSNRDTGRYHQQLLVYSLTIKKIPFVHLQTMTTTSSALGKNAMSYLTLLLNIIESQDWQTFEQAALLNPKAFQSLSNIIATTDEFNGMSFLHAVVRYDPPLDIIARIVKLTPDSPRCCDCLNRTPLHVAAGVGANPATIKFLAMAYPEACKIQDEDGRTPLHFACDVDSQLFEDDDEGKKRAPPVYETVHALLSASLETAQMEDEDGMSPLEYAIFSNADMKVIKLMQKAAQRYMKNKAAAEQKEKALSAGRGAATA